ncbi:glycosyl transferase family 1, partial [Neisseria meningitidis]
MWFGKARLFDRAFYFPGLNQRLCLNRALAGIARFKVFNRAVCRLTETYSGLT